MTTVREYKDNWKTEDAYTYHVAENQSLSTAVIQAVAAVSERSSLTTDGEDGQTALEPLYETIDPDALNALFYTTEDETPSLGAVEFVYCGYEVIVASTGVVRVTDH